MNALVSHNHQVLLLSISVSTATSVHHPSVEEGVIGEAKFQQREQTCSRY